MVEVDPTATPTPTPTPTPTQAPTQTPTPPTPPAPTPTTTAPVTSPTKSGGGLALAGMITGIVSLALFWSVLISLPAALAGLGMSIASLVMKKPNKGMAIAGVVTSALTLLILFGIVLIGFIMGAQSALQDAATQ